MRFIDIYHRIQSLSDYFPDNDEYKEDVRDEVNGLLSSLYSMRNWLFAERELNVTAYADDEADDGTVTNGSRSVTTATAFFEDWHEGQILVGPDGVEHTVVQVDSTTQAYIEDAYSGATVGGTAELTVIHRFVDLPEDCVQVIRIWNQDDDELYYGLSRGAEYAMTLDRDETGTPDYWIPGDAAHVPSPMDAPAATATAGGTMTVGDYEIIYTLSYAGRESAPSTVAEVSTTAANKTIEITLPDYGADEGWKKNLYIRFGDRKAYRLVQADIAGDTTTVTLTSPIETAWRPDTKRVPENSGHYLRIRLDNRQDEDITATVRYIKRPERVIEDTDSPDFPAAHHSYLVYRALADILIRHDNERKAQTFERRAAIEERRMRARYIRPESVQPTKIGGWSVGNLRRRSYTGKVTHA